MERPGAKAARMTRSYRPARPDDAAALFALRRQSILALAPAGMPVAEAERWACGLTPSGMADKLRDLEVWIASCDDRLAGWGAIRGDRLEGLYTAPDLAGQGVGGGLLAMLEGLMQTRGIAMIHAEASGNAEAFYLRRGYRRTGPALVDGALPIGKRLLP